MIHKLANRLAYLNTLIQKRATGTPAQIAQKLGITERAWYKIRDQLIHDLNVPLAYDPQQQTYYYQQDGQLLFTFQRRLHPNDMEKLEGGLTTSVPLGTLIRTQVSPLNWQFSEWS